MNSVTEVKKELKRHIITFLVSGSLTALLIFIVTAVPAYAAGIKIDMTTTADGTGALGALEIMFLFTLISLLPSILLMMTSFTRIVIVLSFLRNALGTQSSPPNQIIIGLALFLTLFIMQPVLSEIKTQAYEPYRAGEITSQQAVEKAIVPLKQFMIRQTDKKSLNLYISISGRTDISFNESNAMEVLSQQGLDIIVPAFITSELNRAFTMGFLIFLPFLIIDIVVSSLLMSMGMVMLPPAMIALPFKIMMFVLVDGWSLLLGTLSRGFH